MIPSVRFDKIYATITYLYFASNIWVPSFARCRLTNDSRKPKVFSHFGRQMLLNLVPKCDFVWIVSCSWSNHIILLLMFVAEKVLLLLVISLTVDTDMQRLFHSTWSPLLSFHVQKEVFLILEENDGGHRIKRALYIGIKRLWLHPLQSVGWNYSFIPKTTSTVQYLGCFLRQWPECWRSGMSRTLIQHKGLVFPV